MDSTKRPRRTSKDKTKHDTKPESKKQRCSMSEDQPKSFTHRVYIATQLIPKGKVCTYKEIARICLSPKAFRAAGNALRHNPYAPEVPCHRVISNAGCLGGFLGSKDSSTVESKFSLL